MKIEIDVSNVLKIKFIQDKALLYKQIEKEDFEGAIELYKIMVTNGEFDAFDKEKPIYFLFLTSLSASY